MSVKVLLLEQLVGSKQRQASTIISHNKHGHAGIGIQVTVSIALAFTALIIILTRPLVPWAQRKRRTNATPCSTVPYGT